MVVHGHRRGSNGLLLDSLLGRVHEFHESLRRLIRFLASHDARVGEHLRIGVENRRRSLDGVRHERIGERGFIRLVVTELSESPEIDHDILLERLSILVGHEHDRDGHFRITGVHVEDGDVHASLSRCSRCR